MAILSAIRDYAAWGCLAAALFAGCDNTPERVNYYGPRLSGVRSAVIVKTSPEQLRAAGYVRIGTIQSEPTTQSGRFADTPDEQTLIEQLAPENSSKLAMYYTRLDEQTCKRAAQAGGSVIRLEEIRHTFPPFRPETAVLKGTDAGKDIKSVTSVKVWSVWRLVEKD